MKLSVLDQSVMRKGDSATDAFRNTVKLAQLTDELGYTRFWVAEHHNTNGIAGSSPEILISHIAARTNRIRVGSGGVLLSQYSPYKIAENFKVLEALYPNRIDLGFGRSPGGSPSTRLALTDGVRKSMNDFPRQVKDLKGYLMGELPKEHPYHHVIAYPKISTILEMWQLGITPRGARVAAENGIAFTYGHFINPTHGKQAIDYYLNNFVASEILEKPKVNICIFIICAQTQEIAEELALSQDLWLLAVEKGEDTRIVSFEEAKSKSLSIADKKKIQENRKRMIVGTPEIVKEEIQKLSERYQTDEFMILSNLYDIDAKQNMYTLLAETFI